jgi:hypothetical protein
MIKKLTLPLLIGLIILSLTGCVTAGTPAAATSVPTSNPTIIPPTATIAPTFTPLPATKTPTEAPSETPTLTPTEAPIEMVITPTFPPTEITPYITPVYTIKHFSSGQALTITKIHMLDENTGWSIGGQTKAGDHVLYTTNGGATWKDVTPPEATDDNGMQKTAIGYFQDALTAWVTYSI